MHLRLACLLVLLALPVSAQSERPIDPAQDVLRFSERSPNSKALKDADYAIEKETFRAYYPKRWDPKKAKRFGLFLWMSPMHYGVIPPMWKKLLDKKKLIGVGPDNVGNKRGTPTRLGLALDAVYHLLILHPELNRERIYVGGFSGGGNMACLLTWRYPDLFRGGVYMGGSIYHRTIPVKNSDRFWGRHIRPAPPEETLKIVREQTTHVHLVGTEDQPAHEHAEAIMGAMRQDGFQRAHFLEVRKLGHDLPKAKQLEKAFKLLDQRAKTKQPKEPKAEKGAPASRPASQD